MLKILKNRVVNRVARVKGRNQNMWFLFQKIIETLAVVKVVAKIMKQSIDDFFFRPVSLINDRWCSLFLSLPIWKKSEKNDIFKSYFEIHSSISPGPLSKISSQNIGPSGIEAKSFDQTRLLIKTKHFGTI